MRYRAGLLAVVILLATTVSCVALGPTGTVLLPKDTIAALDGLNRILDQMIDGVSNGSLTIEELNGLLTAAFAAFEDVLIEMPVAGLLFSDVFAALYTIKAALVTADQMFRDSVSEPYAYHAVLLEAEIAKDELRWAASGGLIRTQEQCASGRALVSVYPGFDCYELMHKLRELFAAGKCVTLSIHEAAGFDPASAGPLGQGPNATRVYACLGGSFHTGPTFEIRRDGPAGASGYTEEHVFGDSSATAHVSQTPRAPHATYVDSALASDIRSGEPIRISPSSPFAYDDVVKPWVKVENVCSPLDVQWNFYSPSGALVYTDGQTLDPVEYNQDCLSSFSTAGWTTLEQSTFGEGGQYTVELWLGGQHTANHTFRMEGSGPLPPWVYDDDYAMNEDTVLGGDAGSLLGNDLDPNGDLLTVSPTDPPRHGSLDLAPDGTFTYTPDPDFYGVDWFGYRAADPGGLHADGGVTILVNPVRDPPRTKRDEFDIAVSPDGRTWTVTVPFLDWSHVVLLDETGIIDIPAPGVLMNDFDPDHEPLTATAEGAPDWITMSADGSLRFHIQGAESPPETVIFVYEVTDGAGLQAVEEVEVRVTRNP